MRMSVSSCFTGVSLSPLWISVSWGSGPVTMMVLPSATSVVTRSSTIILMTCSLLAVTFSVTFCLEVDNGWLVNLVGWLEFNVPFQHKYGYIRDKRSGEESYPLTQWRKASDILTSTLAAFLFSSHPKRERDREAHLQQGKTTITPQD